MWRWFFRLKVQKPELSHKKSDPVNGSKQSVVLCLISAAPSKAPPAPPPPPPPPPGEEKKDDAPTAEEEEEKEIELPFKLLGHPVKIPRLPKLSKLPPLPDWLRVILEYRFPSSIDPYTGEPTTRHPQQPCLDQH